MPFDYNEFSKGVAKAREAKVSDDDILSHLTSIDQGFKDAKENGYSLDEIDSFLKEKYKTKGGENNNAYQTSQDNQGGDGDRNAQEGQAVQVQAGSPEGVQANVQPSSQDQQVVQRSEQANLKITSPLTGESNLGIGGEPLEKPEAMSVGPRYKGPQAEVQQAIPSQATAGEQAEVAPKPAPFPTVPSEGDRGKLGLFAAGIGSGLGEYSQLSSRIKSLSPENAMLQGIAKGSEYLFGQNQYSDALKTSAGQKIELELARQFTESNKITPQEDKSLLNSMIYTTGKFIPDLVVAGITGGLSEGVTGVKLAAEGVTSIWKSIAGKVGHGLVAFSIPSLSAANNTITDEKQKGASDSEALTEGIKTLFESEAGAALPQVVSSKAKNVLLRAGERLLKAYPLALVQSEIVGVIHNLWSKEGKESPTLVENIAKGNWDAAIRQAGSAIPMALLGAVTGENKYKLSEEAVKSELPETASAISQPQEIPQPKPPKFATRETLLYNGQRRYTDLSSKRESGKELTPEEAEELSVLEKVPTVEELASHYGITIQESKKKPAKAKAEAQPEKPSEEQVKEASGVSTEQGKSPVEVTAVKAKEGTPQREGEGKKEVTSFAEASTPEEVDAFLKRNQEDAKLIQDNTKQRNSFLSQARKQAVARKKEIKAEQAKKAKEEASKPKPSEKPVTEDKAPEPEPAPEDAPTEQGEPKARKPRKEKPSEPMGTRVLSAAFRPNKGKNKGKVFYGASHKQAMLKSGMSWMEIQKDYAHPEQREGLEFGYKTDTKPFVSRDKAEQVARLSGQADVAKLDADKANGYKMHSNHLSLDDHPKTQGVDEKFGPGAMKKPEKGVPFGEKDHNDDLVKSAKIHKDLAKGDFKGGTNYSAWSKAFEKAFENSKNYSEDERFNLFKQGESLAAHSEFFKKDPEQSVKFPKMWSGKSAEEIKNESIDYSTQDIRFTNKAIDDEREARGLDPIMKQAAIASGEHWDEAMEQINSREGYAAAFVNSLKRNVRVLSPVETSILRHSVAESMAKRDSAAGRLSRETDPRIIKRLSREYDDAQRDYAEISELYSRTNSEAGRALGFLRMLVKADYSLPTLITKARAAKRRGGKGDANLTKEERDGLAKISEEIDKAEKDFVDSLEAQKLKENKLGLIQYLEFSSKLISTLEGEKKDAKSELNRYSSMFKNSGQDAISMGLAVRGMARNLSQILRTKNEDKILDAVHDRISNIMGDTWGKDQTLDILNGNGVFFHTTEEGIKTPLRGVKERSDAFNKQFANALKKSQSKREFILSKMLERFSIEVHNLEAQINGHMDDVAIDADRIIGELDNDLLSCE